LSSLEHNCLERKSGFFDRTLTRVYRWPVSTGPPPPLSLTPFKPMERLTRLQVIWFEDRAERPARCCLFDSSRWNRAGQNHGRTVPRLQVSKRPVGLALLSCWGRPYLHAGAWSGGEDVYYRTRSGIRRDIRGVPTAGCGWAPVLHFNERALLKKMVFDDEKQRGSSISTRTSYL